MQDEKQFGRIISNAQSILGARDLLQLGVEHEAWYSRSDPCFICTATGKVPQEPEEECVIIKNRTVKEGKQALAYS